MAKSRQQAPSQTHDESGYDSGATAEVGVFGPDSAMAYQGAMGNAAVQEMAREGGHDHSHDHESARDGSRPSTPRTKRDALSRHQRNTDMVKRIISSGLSIQPDPSQGFNSRPNLLRNSAEWIDQNHADMFILTPVHDSHLRPSVAADKTGYFDTRVNWRGSGADYDDSLNAAGQATNDAGLSIKFSGVLGSLSGDGATLTLVDPLKQGEALLTETIIHEVQHDADQHKAGDPWAVTKPATDDPNAVDVAPASQYNGYQSEFRAYWMENPEGSSADNYGDSTDTAVDTLTITALEQGADQATGGGDDVSKTVTTSFKNKRQQTIFEQLYNQRTDNLYWDWTANGGSGAWTVTYGYLPHYYALDPNFKSMVDNYALPSAGNLVNSVRLQALSDALGGGNFDAVKAAANALDALDLQYLSDRAQSQPMWTQAQSALSAAEFTEFEGMINAPIGPFLPESVTVQRGDTLGRLAERYLNDARRYREIHDLNRDVIGDDPDRIQVGVVLQLPRM